MIIRSKAPLRLGFAGGGTDVSPYCDEFGGQVMNATISLYAHCTLHPTDDDQVVFVAQDIDCTETFTTQTVNTNGRLKLHAAVYRRIMREFNDNQFLAMQLTTHCDAPPGSGLGSSSTLVVAMIKCFVEWLSLPLGEYEIAKLAFDIERIELGMAGGCQDQYAATFGGFNFLEIGAHQQVIVNPLRIKNWVMDELEESLILYFTGASRDSSKIIEEQIKHAKQHDKGSLDATHEVRQDAILMKNALLRGETQEFATLLGKAWQAKKRMAQGISNSHIDHIYQTAIAAGAKSGKVSGAGGGGFMLFYVDPAKRVKIEQALQALGGMLLPFKFVHEGTRGWRLR